MNARITASTFIALLTDFGHDDPFVGIMKAVLFTRCPDARVVDLTHSIPPQSVGEGAFWIERSLPWLPTGAVVVAVVDPGVGTARAPLVLRAHERIFVGPDNGLFAGVAASDPSSVAHAIDNVRLGLAVPSRTFHGRDLFAPVAAEIAAARLDPADVGPALPELCPPLLPIPTEHDGVVNGVVVSVDRFGNLITNIERRMLPDDAVVEVAGVRTPLAKTYADAPPGEVVALVNAFDVLEIAVRNGSATALLALGRGAQIAVRKAATAPG